MTRDERSVTDILQSTESQFPGPSGSGSVGADGVPHLVRFSRQGFELLTHCPFVLRWRWHKEWASVEFDYNSPFRWKGDDCFDTVNTLKDAYCAWNREDVWFHESYGNSVITARFPIQLADFGLRAMIAAEMGDGHAMRVVADAVNASRKIDAFPGGKLSERRNQSKLFVADVVGHFIAAAPGWWMT